MGGWVTSGSRRKGSREEEKEARRAFAQHGTGDSATDGDSGAGDQTVRFENQSPG